MNKARPLLLERPGFFSAVRVGAGQRAAAGRGRGPPLGGGESCCEAGERRALYCGAQCAARLREARRAPQGRTENTEKHTGHPQSGQGAPQGAWGIPERMGHRRAHGGTAGRMGAPQGAQDIPGRTGGNAGRAGHPRAHRGNARGVQGVPQSARDTADRTEPPQGAQGHPWAQGGASKQSVCGRKKGPPAAARRGQKNLFLLREKNFKFFGKNS